MVWKVFWFAEERQAVAPSPALIRLFCEDAWSEDEARLRAMRHYDRRNERVSVRCPGRAKPIAGRDLEEWLVDRLSGPV